MATRSARRSDAPVTLSSDAGAESGFLPRRNVALETSAGEPDDPVDTAQRAYEKLVGELPGIVGLFAVSLVLRDSFREAVERFAFLTGQVDGEPGLAAFGLLRERLVTVGR